VFAVLPILEVVVPDDLANPTDEESRRAAKDWRYKMPLVLWIIPQCVAIVAGARAFCDVDASFHRRLGLVLSAGVCTGGVGITVAHELLHKTTTLELFLAKVLLTSVCYAHFCVEHRFGHHRRVGTPDDPASAKRYTSFYAFFVKSVVGTYRGAWRIWRGEDENAVHLGQVAKKTFGETFMTDAHVAPALWAVGLFFANKRDIKAVCFFLLQALVAVTLLELVNYVEHYGLTRVTLGDDITSDDRVSTKKAYEPVTPAHSWNAPQRVTNWFVFRLQRHSDHHARAATPYQALRTYAEAPTLPTGYTGTMLVALAPPWFEKCLGPVLDARRADANGDVSAEKEERLQKKRRDDAGALARRRARDGVLVATALVTAVAWAPTLG
jgi:alkane 1-monooxygenase